MEKMERSRLVTARPSLRPPGSILEEVRYLAKETDKKYFLTYYLNMLR